MGTYHVETNSDLNINFNIIFEQTNINRNRCKKNLDMIIKYKIKNVKKK